MTDNPPFECGPEYPAPDHHASQGQTSASVHVQAAGHEPGQIYAGESRAQRQALAPMGPESGATGPEPGCWPSELEPEAGT